MKIGADEMDVGGGSDEPLRATVLTIVADYLNFWC